MTVYQPARGGYSPPPPTDPHERQVFDICEARRWSFFQSWVIDPGVVVYATEERIKFALTGSTGELERAALPPMAPLGKKKFHNVRVLIHPGSDPVFSKSLWVRAGYDDYKLAFVDFLEEVHGCQVGSSLASLGFDVDHLRNRKRVHPDTFIRVEPTPSKPQQMWGTTYERWASHPMFEKTPQGVASWPLVLKLCGVHPPTGWGDEQWLSNLQVFIDENKISDPMRQSVEHVRRELARVYLPRKHGREALMAHRKDLDEREARRHPGVPLWSSAVLDD